jgi:hypothetical protein
VFSIFGSAWLNLRQIERIMESLRNELKAGMGELRAEIKALDQIVEHGLARVRTETSSLGPGVERIERQLDKAFNLTLK